MVSMKTSMTIKQHFDDVSHIKNGNLSIDMLAFRGVLFVGECGMVSNLLRLAHLPIESLSDWVLIFGGLLLHIQQTKNRRGSNVDMKCGSFSDIFNVNLC